MRWKVVGGHRFILGLLSMMASSGLVVYTSWMTLTGREASGELRFGALGLLLLGWLLLLPELRLNF
jgi:hypothetical protein